MYMNSYKAQKNNLRFNFFFYFFIFLSVQIPNIAYPASNNCDNAIFKIYKGKLAGAVDHVGKIKIDPKFESLKLGEQLSMALASPPFPAKLPSGNFGYVDLNGSWIIQPNYEFATTFKNGVAAVQDLKGKKFIINLKGEKMGEDWTDISLSDEGITTVVKGSKIFYLGSNGSMLFESPSDPLVPEVKDKNRLISANDSFFFKFNEGLAPFRKKDHWGLINAKGKIVIIEQFDSVSIYRDFIVVSLGDRQGLVDRTGNYILNPSKVNIQCENVENICSAQTLGTYDFKLFSVKKKKFLPGIYSDFKGCSEGLCIAIKQNGKGCDVWAPCPVAMDTEGRIVAYLPKASGFVTGFHDGFGSFSKFSDKQFTMGFFNKKGHVTISPQFDDPVSEFACGLALVSIGVNRGLINKKGEFVWNPQ